MSLVYHIKLAEGLRNEDWKFGNIMFTVGVHNNTLPSFCIAGCVKVVSIFTSGTLTSSECVERCCGQMLQSYEVKYQY